MIDGLNPYTGNVTQGLRGNFGGENAFWGIDPRTGKEVPVIGGYLLPDLLQKFGSIDAIHNYGANPNAFVPDGDTQGYATQGPFAQSLDIFGARPSNDTFSGKDGLNDLITIGAMAAPVIAGAAGGAAAASSGAGATAADGGVAGYGSAGDAAVGGGEGVNALGGTGEPGMWDWLDEVGGGSFDQGGSQGVFDSYGNPQYSSPGGLMPPAVPETDPTFGGELKQTAPGVYSQPTASSGGLSDILKNSGGLANVLKGILAKGASAGAGGTSGSALSMGLGDMAFNSAPFLLALAEAQRQSGDLNGVINKINGEGYTRAVLNPYDNDTGIGRSNMLQDLSLRGVSGSSFGNQQLGNYDYMRALGRGDMASKAQLSAAGLEGSLINQKNTNRNMLLGAGLNASAKLFSPQQDPFGLRQLMGG